jgi:serine/threonine-protein phosphatase 2A regulatory subunit B
MKTQVNDGEIVLPKHNVLSSGYEGTERKQFKHCHNYNINCLSTSPDGEVFISSDDLCINLWSLENNIVAFNIVNLKPRVL